MNLRRLQLPWSALLLTALLSTPALAQGDDCYRDSECDADEHCIARNCTEVSGIVSCEADDDCSYREQCVDNACKDTRVRCDNPAGTCHIESDEGGCACKAGDGVGWSNPDGDEATDEELYEDCVESLELHCGTELPKLPESCRGERLEICEQVAENMVHWDDTCDGWSEDSFAYLYGCCVVMEEGYEDEQEAMHCISELELDDDCAKASQEIEDCLYLDDDTNEEGPDDDPDDAEDSGDDGDETGQDANDSDEDQETGDASEGESGEEDPGDDDTGEGDSAEESGEETGEDKLDGSTCRAVGEPGRAPLLSAGLLALGLLLRRRRSRV